MPENFLSCLYGSERIYGFKIVFPSFLSCLYGSEHNVDFYGDNRDVSKLPVRQ